MLRCEAESFEAVQPSWINECGDLSVNKLGAIFRYVWADVVEE